MCTFMERNGLAPPGWVPGRRSRPLAGEIDDTVAELHVYLTGFILDGAAVPPLEVDTGDGQWRGLAESSVAASGQTSEEAPVTLYFTSDPDGLGERFPAAHRVRARPVEGADAGP